MTENEDPMDETMNGWMQDTDFEEALDAWHLLNDTDGEVYALNAAYNSRDYAHDMICEHGIQNFIISMHRDPDRNPPQGPDPSEYTLLMFSDSYYEPGMRKVRCRIDEIKLMGSEAGNPYLTVHIDPNSYSDPKRPYRQMQQDYNDLEIIIGPISEDRIKLRRELTE